MPLVAYLGPETMLPVTSVLAGALGFLMMFGRRALALGIRVVRPKAVASLPPTRARGHRPTTSRITATTSGFSPSDAEDNVAV